MVRITGTKATGLKLTGRIVLPKKPTRVWRMNTAITLPQEALTKLDDVCRFLHLSRGRVIELLIEAIDQTES
jgi:hypothetical protein